MTTLTSTPENINILRSWLDNGKVAYGINDENNNELQFDSNDIGVYNYRTAKRKLKEIEKNKRIICEVN